MKNRSYDAGGVVAAGFAVLIFLGIGAAIFGYIGRFNCPLIGRQPSRNAYRGRSM